MEQQLHRACGGFNRKSRNYSNSSETSSRRLFLAPCKITFQPVGQLDENDYVKVRLVGSQHDLVSAVTQLFQEGQNISCRM